MDIKDIKLFDFHKLKNELLEMIEQIDRKAFLTQNELYKWLFSHKYYLTLDTVYRKFKKEEDKFKLSQVISFLKHYAYTFYLYAKLEKKIFKKLQSLPERGS